MASMNTRLNIKKLDGNIVQKHGCSKQVGFKQLGPCVETRVHGVHDEKRVWFEVKPQGAQGDHEVEVFQVSNDDTIVAQRWLEDKQPEEKTNTDCLVYTTMYEEWVWSVRGSLGRGYNHVYISSEQGHHHQRLKTPIDMLGFFGWLASKRQGMLEPVKVKCIFLGYRKGIVGNKLWRFDDVTSKVVLYRNMSFNESREYKKTFIGSGVGTGSMQALQGDEFEVEPQDGHTFEVKPHGNVDHVVASQEYREDSNEAAFVVAAVEKNYAYESLIFNDTVACEVISKWKAGLKDDMDARSDVYVLNNGLQGECKDTAMSITRSIHQIGPRVVWLKKRKGNILGLEIIPPPHHTVGSQKYQMVCTRLDIASADVGMLDKV
ncbi:hypothetical protein Tco_0861711 [Tanacetum coccineum]|uniref:Retroviral polymerase SH3-like domain-containing protein n=1 Tax=Tanacetum coccineum TaxID=301880 RepID=A0ABQ5BMR7_9ASTR